MTLMPLTSLQAVAYDTETGVILFRAIDSAGPNHPDPVSFSSSVEYSFALTPASLTIRNLATGEPSDEHGNPLPPAPEPEAEEPVVTPETEEVDVDAPVDESTP